MATTAETTTYVTQTEVAKMVRAVLKKAYGKFPFSVRTKKYSGGSSITVYWTDGPTTKAVDALIGHFCGADFDGMTDSKSYHDAETLIAPDGTIRHIHYANDFIFTQRSISDWDQKVKDAEEYIKAHCDLTPVGHTFQFGNEWLDHVSHRMVYAHDYTKSDTLETAFQRGVLRQDI